jgi:cytidylate kinase
VTYSITGPHFVAAGTAEDHRPAGDGLAGAGQPDAASQPGRGAGLVIAVDGPSGSGKSSAARGTAVALGLRYLDTGAMYRAVTWWLLANGVDPADRPAVAARLPGIVVDVSTDPQDQAVGVNGTDVTAEIRTRQVSNAVSLVAAIPQVRGRLIAQQQQVIGAAVTAGGGIVAEGRDIGTVVAPEATVKVFLTASEEARAQRRAAELARGAAAGAAHGLAAVAGPVPTAEATRLEQARRDRKDAPQSQRAADAIEIDATDLGLDDVIGLIVSLATRQAGAGWTS